MDTMRISGVSSGAESLIQCNALSSLVGRRSDNGRWRTRSRTWRLAPKRRLFPSVKAVSSEPKEKVADVVIDSEQGPSSSFFLFSFKKLLFLSVNGSSIRIKFITLEFIVNVGIKVCNFKSL